MPGTPIHTYVALNSTYAQRVHGFLRVSMHGCRACGSYMCKALKGINTSQN